MKLSISFNKPKTGQLVNAIIQPSSAFDTGVDEEVDNDLPISENPRPHAVHAQGSSKLMKKRMEAERRLDETVYEYDEVWDKMQEAKQLQQTAKAVDASARKVCVRPGSQHRTSS
jgi:coiled-coil domain-containing protein 55